MSRKQVRATFIAMPFAVIESRITIETISGPGVTKGPTFCQTGDGNGKASQQAQSTKNVESDPEPILDCCENSLVKEQN